jgi:nitrite reductase/ring-hydroxylating ferredoxin subunit
MLSPDQVDHLVQMQRGRVHASVYTSEDVFAQEMQRIFYTTWVYVGHESEIAQPGDFKTAYVGQIPVILARDDSNLVLSFFNRCPACGSTVCQADSGNTKAFHCLFHDWHFDNRGQLPGLDYRLDRVARIESYRGLIFGNLAQTGPSLEAHLGLGKPYLDYWSDQSPTGSVLLAGGKWRHFYDANWKLQVEAGVDGYRRDFLRSLGPPQSADRRSGRRKGESKSHRPRSIDLGNGHSFLEDPERFNEDWFTAQPPGYVEALIARLGREKVKQVLGSGAWRLQIFPNLCIAPRFLRVVRPVSVSRTEVVQHNVALPDVPDAVNEKRLHDHQAAYGPAGTEGPQDLEMFARIQEAFRTAEAPGLNQWAHFSRGLNAETLGPDGERLGDITSELPQRALYRAWSTLMKAEPPPILTEAVIELRD